MWAPQPAQVGLWHVGHVVCLHIPHRVSPSDAWTNTPRGIVTRVESTILKARCSSVSTTSGVCRTRAI
jgi:hypothetical protein